MANSIALTHGRCQILVLRTVKLLSGSVTHSVIPSVYRQGLDANQAGRGPHQPQKMWFWHKEKGPHTHIFSHVQPAEVTASICEAQMSQRGLICHPGNQSVGKGPFLEFTA